MRLSIIQRHFTLLLLSASLLLGCENTERQTQVQVGENTPSTEADTLEPEEFRVQVLAGADTTILSNSLMNSLMPLWTVEEVMRKVPKAQIDNREPMPNRHVSGQVDTLITIRSDSTVIQFYSLADRDMLESASLRQEGIAMGGGLQVGMLAEEVAERIPALRGKKAIPQTILIRAEQTPTSLRLRFKNNRLSHIDYDGYVD